MRECVNGAMAAVEKAKQLDTEVILVDSTGLVEGEDARRFKLLEIDAIHPSLVVAIENEHELKHILEHLDLRVIRLLKSREARERTREERRALREAAYDSYFRVTQDRTFDLSTVTEPLEEGTLVGLVSGACGDRCTGDEILGLGILRDLDSERETVVVLTPVDTETGIKEALVIQRVKPGGVKLTEVHGHLEEFR
jgi:polynucleotide 5'-kinase involved in rRNA processing